MVQRIGKFQLQRFGHSLTTSVILIEPGWTGTITAKWQHRGNTQDLTPALGLAQ